MPLLQLPNQFGNQPLKRLPGGFGMHRRLLQPEGRTRRRVGYDRGQRFGLAAERAIERIDHILRAPEPPRQRKPRHVHQRADGLQAQPFERADGVRVEAKCGYGEWRELLD